MISQAIDPVSMQAGGDVLERILATSSGLVLLQSEDIDLLVEQLRALVRRSGQAVYLWQPGAGLSSLRDAHVRVPDCLRLCNALRYMQQSMHFGVYFLSGLQLPLSATDDSLLRQLASAPQGFLRRVVLLNAPAALAEHLGDRADHLTCYESQPRRLRLRDGRWLHA